MPGGRLRVLVVGAGLSGLCLAHGLRTAGIDVVVVERDPVASGRSQGYRLSVAPEGTRALRECLPPSSYELVVATAGKRGRGVTVLDPGLRVVRRFAGAPAPDPDDGSAGISIDRENLRRILLDGLDGTVHFGAVHRRFDVRHDGTVQITFADGGTAVGDLLVGADGASSRVRAQLLPGAEVVDVGDRLIFGKTRLTEQIRRVAPPAALDGFSGVAGSGGRSLLLAGLEHRDGAVRLPAGRSDRSPLDLRDYLMWVVAAPADAFPPALHPVHPEERDGGRLRETAAAVVHDWHPALSEIVLAGDPDSVSATAVREARPVEPWATGPVTLVGDAIHCMRPSGIGAAVALHDAALLTRHLREVHEGRASPARSVAGYEAEMLDNGFAAVAAAAAMASRASPGAEDGGGG